MQSDQQTTEIDREALLEAAKYGELTKCQALLNQWQEHGSLSRPTPKELAPSLTEAIISKHVHAVAFLLQNGAAVSGHDMIYAMGETDISIAMFQTFLDHGWDPNSKTNLGNVMLKHVIRDERLTRWFLEHGADANFGKIGCNSLDVAAANSKPQVYDLLVAHGARVEDSDALHTAAGECEHRPGRVELMAHLLHLGFDVNAMGRRDFPPGRRIGRGTPLHAAMAPGQTDRIDLLLRHGADAQVKNTLDQTPLEYAVAKGYSRSRIFLERVIGSGDALSGAQR